MSTNNAATIELKADPKGVEEGTKKAKASVNSLKDEYKQLIKQLEQFQRGNELTNFVKENAVQTGILLAIWYKFGAQLALIIGVAAKAAGALKALTVGTIALGGAAASTTRNIAVTTYEIGKLVAQIVVAHKLMNPYTISFAVLAGAMKLAWPVFEQTGKRIKSLGVNMDESTLIFETNADRMSKAFRKLVDEGLGMQKMRDLVNDVNKSIGKSIDFAATKYADATESIAKSVTKILKSSQYIFARGIARLPGFANQNGNTVAEIDRDRKRDLGSEAEKKRLEAEKRYQDLTREGREREAAYMLTRYQTIKEEQILKEAAANKSLIAIKKEIEEHGRLRQILVQNGTFAGQLGDEWVKKANALEAVQSRLIEQQKEIHKLAMETGEERAKILKQLERQNEAEVLSVKNVAQLVNELEDANDELDDLVAQQDNSDGKFAEKRIAALQKVQMLEEMIVERKKRETEEQSQRDLAAIDAEKAKMDAVNTRTHERRVQNLKQLEEEELRQAERQGADANKLAEIRRKYSAEERNEKDMYLDAIRATQQEIDQATHEKRLRDMQIEADKKRQLEHDSDRQTDRNQDLLITKAEAKHRIEMANLQLQQATAKKMYEAEIAFINEMEKLELSRAADADRQSDIRAQKEKERIRATTEFQVAEAERLQRAKQEALARGEEVITPQAFKNRAMQNAELRKAKADNKTAITKGRQEQKDARLRAKEEKRLAMRDANAAKKAADIARKNTNKQRNEKVQKFADSERNFRLRSMPRANKAIDRDQVPNLVMPDFGRVPTGANPPSGRGGEQTQVAHQTLRMMHDLVMTVKQQLAVAGQSLSEEKKIKGGIGEVVRKVEGIGKLP